MSRSFFLVATFLTECLIYQQTFKVIFGDGMIGFVIGDSDMITGFRLVGIEGIEASTIDEARQAFHKSLSLSDIGVIIISEAFFSDTSLREEVDKVRQERVTPLIVEIPGSKGMADKMQLSEMISKILGIKI
jgi:vacuolar-type H+-ATPase subunit F/Vma7